MTGFTGIFSKHFSLETWRQSAPFPFSRLPPLLVGKDWGLMLNLALAVSRLSFIYVVWTAQFPRYYSSDHPTAAAIGYFNITQSSARYQEETFLPYLGIPYNGGRVAHASKWHSSEACEHPCTPLCGPQRLPSEWGMYKRLSLVSAAEILPERNPIYTARFETSWPTQAREVCFACFRGEKRRIHLSVTTVTTRLLTLTHRWHRHCTWIHPTNSCVAGSTPQLAMEKSTSIFCLLTVSFIVLVQVNI